MSRLRHGNHPPLNRSLVGPEARIGTQPPCPTNRPSNSIGFWRSSATYRVRVALALKGLAAQEHIIDLDAGDQHTDAFRAINPLAALPALILPGQPPLTQSLAILEYLNETVPNPPLLPPDPSGRARVRSIAAGLAADTHPLIVPRVRQYPHHHRRLRPRRLARLANPLVHRRTSGPRTAPRDQIRHRRLLPRQRRHHRRHPAHEHRRGHGHVQNHRREHPSHRPHRRPLRRNPRLRQRPPVPTGRRPRRLTPPGQAPPPAV